MKCSEVRAFLSEIQSQKETIAPIPQPDLAYLSEKGYVRITTKDDHDKGVADLARFSQLSEETRGERPLQDQASQALWQDTEKAHSFFFHFQAKDEKDALLQRIQDESSSVAAENVKLSSMEQSLNALIQEKSAVDQMVPYGDVYLSLTGTGSIVLNDLEVRDYRVADGDFTDFEAEIRNTYSEFRGIADRAKYYFTMLRPSIPQASVEEYGESWAESVVWSTSIGLGKLNGDPVHIGQRAVQALASLQSFSLLHDLRSTPPNMLMAAEVMTALGGQNLEDLRSAMEQLNQTLRKEGVPKELSTGVAATILAGRRYDGSYPIDTFTQFKGLTPSYEAAAVLGVMNLPFADLSAKFQSFKSLFSSWGYMTSEDTETASAFMAIGELNADEVSDKLKYIVQQLTNYLEYPLVAGAILASIPVFEAHEALDLMEKAVTLLDSYVTELEKSQVVALAVRMIHGVRNEVVKQIDPTAKIVETPVQFTYGWYPGFFQWYLPVVVAHSSYNAIFSGMGGFHPAHSHGVGGFAG